VSKSKTVPWEYRSVHPRDRVALPYQEVFFTVPNSIYIAISPQIDAFDDSGAPEADFKECFKLEDHRSTNITQDKR
jgi:hypothetical protein